MIPAVTTDNKNITEQIAFIHHATTEQSHNVHSTTRLITAEIVAEIRIFVFAFISFIFCLFQKKRHGLAMQILYPRSRYGSPPCRFGC